MTQAVSLAAVHHPHPNPRVGAVVLDAAGRVVGTGGHHGPGTPHAEIHALEEAGAAARGGTVVVTLEPCAHQGRTAPCTSALVEAGVARVIVAVVDPDERVAGRGLAALRAAGIDVSVGTGADEVESLDPGYFHHRRTGRPLVTLKLGMTLDGQVAAADGSSRWITSPESRRDAHELRSRSDALVVGAGTLLADDPRLTVRLPGYQGSQPLAVLVAGERPIPATSLLFAREPLIYAPRPITLPGEVVVLGSGDGVDLPSMIADLGKRGIVDLLVEGGPRLAGALVGAGLVDRFVFYLAASIAGGTGAAAFEGVFTSIGSEFPVEITDLRRIGPDVRIDSARVV